jgi:hypothetical protein
MEETDSVIAQIPARTRPNPMPTRGASRICRRLRQRLGTTIPKPNTHHRGTQRDLLSPQRVRRPGLGPRVKRIVPRIHISWGLAPPVHRLPPRVSTGMASRCAVVPTLSPPPWQIIPSPAARRRGKPCACTAERHMDRSQAEALAVPAVGGPTSS